MSGWNFDNAGRFGSEEEARKQADRAGIDPRDVRTRNFGTEVELEIRRTAGDANDPPRRGWK
ncbi:hypothetical protein FHS96_005611 [Sphingomonas zeicaulis]|uniref:hypothetical protein n=1 Tax=Sphingomonas zeicaulis TaxID=1632740 RepID=UPI003D1C9F61